MVKQNKRLKDDPALADGRVKDGRGPSSGTSPRAYADRRAAFDAGLDPLKAAAAKLMDEAAKLTDDAAAAGIAPGGRLGPYLPKVRGMSELEQVVSGLARGAIVEGDCVDVLDNEREGFADLIFADPPFNIGYLYDGYDDLKDSDSYTQWSAQWIRACHRALKPDGSLFIAIGDDYAAELCLEAKKAGFTMRNWIVWHYTFGQQPKHKFARSHTHILYFVKDAKTFTFNRDAIKVMSARQAIYNDSRAAKGGKIPDDTWYLRPQDVDGSEDAAELFGPDQDVWNESRVCGTFKEREGWHGCQMPLAVLERIIKTASHEGDVVLDPFNGSGTTALAAALLGRRYLGIEQNAEYVTFAKNRIANALTSHGVVGTDGKIDPAKAATKQKVETATDALGRKRTKRKPTKPAKREKVTA